MSALSSAPSVTARNGDAGKGRRDVALALLRRREEPPAALVAEAGFSSMEEVIQLVAAQFKVPRLELDDLELDPGLSDLFTQQMAEKQRIVPVFGAPDEVTIATCDPARIELVDWLSRELKRTVVVVLASPGEISRAIKRLYAPQLEVKNTVVEVEVTRAELEEAAPVVDRLISRAVDMRASDIHIEATDEATVVRYRIDGMLRQMESLPLARHPALISRVKILAQLDITERQVPQDGRIKIHRPSGDIDLRVSVLPTYFGEKVCCRILDNSRACLPLAELGFDPVQLKLFDRMIRSPYGLLLVTGPTGSGKSTTLYGALNAVRSPEINVVSVEDPVEYQLPGINQVQVNPKRGLTFAGALRSILRQDPNVILVGEIRDHETGVIASEAALTGHLVLSSLHTNDAPSAITRLMEMGIEPYLVAPALVGVVAQRLVRKVCTECAEPAEISADECRLLGIPRVPDGARIVRGRGCEACHGAGYKGRTAIRELLEVTPELKPLISRGATADEIEAAATAKGFRSMRYEALKRLFGGQITVQEVLRLTRS